MPFGHPLRGGSTTGYHRAKRCRTAPWEPCHWSLRANQIGSEVGMQAAAACLRHWELKGVQGARTPLLKKHGNVGAGFSQSSLRPRRAAHEKHIH